jgi:adenylate cyclase
MLRSDARLPNAASQPQAGARLHVSRRTLRLASGLTLFAYVTTHLVNHALGLVSLDTAENALRIAVRTWSSVPGTLLLYGAAAIHAGLAFIALYDRRTLRMPAIEIVRYALGFTIPLFVIGHAIATRVAAELGASPVYERVVWNIVQSGIEWRQLALLLLVWVHASIGLYLWLHHRRWFARWSHVLFALVCLVPTLAMLGFFAMTRELAAQAESPAFRNAQELYATELDAAQREALEGLRDRWLYGYAALFALVLGARQARTAIERRRNAVVTLRYPDREVVVPRGHTVLEASRAHHIPHLSLCGGRARCSTCRVRVDPLAACPPAGDDEARTLARIGAPPDVRLACQLRPLGDVAIEPVLALDGRHAPPGRRSVERDIVVLFTDLRRWTGLAERQLPFDLVYVQNRFYAAVGDAISGAGGLPNQFVGDSVMAIFGLDCDVATASRQAFEAVRGMEQRIRAVNRDLEREFAHQLEFGVGLHVGPAVVGEVGWRDTRTTSAVGDTVNTAARLQELTKTYRARLVVSEAVAKAAGLPLEQCVAHEIEVRGRQAPLTVYALPTAEIAVTV